MRLISVPRLTFAAVLVVAILTACGGGSTAGTGGDTGGTGGDTGGTGGDTGGTGGGSANIDVSGNWQINELLGSNTCGDPAGTTDSYTVFATQTGSSLSVVAPSGSYSGSVSANNLVWNGSFAEDGGTVTATINLMIAGTGDSMSGTSNWSWTDGVDSCSGATTVTAVRLSGGAPSPNTGVFVDSPVSGLSYQTTTQSGITDSNGTFTYLEGELVTFRIGNLILGSSIGMPTLSPVQIANAFTADDPRVINIARLLQTLDADNNPDNGITLIAAAAGLPDSVDLDSATSIQAALNTIGGGMLVSENDALAHLLSTLAELPGATEATVYSYTAAASNTTPACASKNWTGATLQVSPLTSGYAFSGSVSRADGAVETFTLTSSNATNANGSSDAGATLSIATDEFAAELFIAPTDTCAGAIYMTTNDTVNLPPTATRSNSTQVICNTANTFYSLGWDMTAYDRDGFIAKHPHTVYTIEGQSEVILSVGANANSNASFGTQAVPRRLDHVDISNIPCTSGVSWEYFVEDNEGAIASISGSYAAPFEDGGFATGAGDYCATNYSIEACTSLNSDADIQTQFVANLTCASAFPNADDFSGADFGCSTTAASASCGACAVQFSSARAGRASRSIDAIVSDAWHRQFLDQQ